MNGPFNMFNVPWDVGLFYKAFNTPPHSLLSTNAICILCGQIKGYNSSITPVMCEVVG